MPKSKIDIILEAYDRMTTPINAAVNKAQAKLTSFAEKTDKLANKAYHSGKEMTVAGFAVAAPLYKAFDAASEFETKMIDIRKQLGKDDIPANVKKMTDEVFKLSKEIPLATDEIQDMIASGLRMDIPKEKIVAYTKDVAKMATAFDMDPGEISDSMGKIAGLYDIPLEKINDLADSINYLDDKSKTKGPELITTMQNIGGSVSKYLKPEQAAALASTMLTLGETPDRASTGIRKLISVLGGAESKSKKTQETFRALGLSPAQLQKDMVTNAQGTIENVLAIIARQPADKQKGILYKLFGEDHMGKIEKLSNGIKEYQRQLGLAQGTEKVGSMQEEFNKRMEGSAAQMQLFKNRIHELWVKIGTNLLPTVNKIIVRIGAWLDKVGKFIEEHPELVKGILQAAMGFSALTIGLGYLSFVFSGFFRLLNFGSKALKGITGVVNFLTDKKKGLSHWIFVVRYRMLQFQQFVTGKALPAIKQAGSYIGGKFKDAFNATSQFITGKALPALKQAGSYIGGKFKSAFNVTSQFVTGKAIPAFKACGTYIAGGFSKAMRIGATAFKVLGAAFTANPIGFVLKALAIIATVVFGALIAKFGSVRGALNALGNFFKKVGRALFAPIQIGIDLIKKPIEWVINKFEFLKKIVETGKRIFSMIFGGGKSKKDTEETVQTVSKTTQEIRDHLPSSPAKKGALKDLNKVDLFGTIAKTMQVSPVMKVVKGVTGGVFGFLKRSVLGPLSPQAGGATMTANFNIYLNGSATKQDGQMLRKEIEKCIADLQKKQARVSFA